MSSSAGENLFQLVTVLVIFVVVLALTFYITKWIAGYQRTRIHHRNFKVIETMKVAQNKYLQIVQVGKDDYFVIGIGKDEVTMLGKVTKEQLLDTGEDDSPGGGFADVLSSFRGIGSRQTGKK